MRRPCLRAQRCVRQRRMLHRRRTTAWWRAQRRRIADRTETTRPSRAKRRDGRRGLVTVRSRRSRGRKGHERVAQPARAGGRAATARRAVREFRGRPGRPDAGHAEDAVQPGADLEALHLDAVDHDDALGVVAVAQGEDAHRAPRSARERADRSTRASLVQVLRTTIATRGAASPLGGASGHEGLTRRAPTSRQLTVLRSAFRVTSHPSAFVSFAPTLKEPPPNGLKGTCDRDSR